MHDCISAVFVASLFEVLNAFQTFSCLIHHIVSDSSFTASSCTHLHHEFYYNMALIVIYGTPLDYTNKSLDSEDVI